jgi:hypothetical protein
MPTVLESLDLIKKNLITPQTISFLYGNCYKIAYAAVSKKYGQTSHSFFTGDTAIENIATDAIAPLFLSAKPNEPISLYKSLIQWSTPINTEAEAEFFLIKIVTNRVAQHITKLLKDTDPVFKKIHGSLKHFADKNGYNRIYFLGVLYITLPADKEIFGPLIPSEILESLPINLFSAKLDKVLENLFHYIDKETDYFPAIPINAIVRKIKLLIGNEFLSPWVEATYPNYEEQIDIEKLIDRCLSKVYKGINELYSYKVRLNDEMLDAYRSVLRDISIDLQNGGINRGIFDYFNNYFADITKDQFYERHYSHLNYLILQLKKGIADQIKAN